MYLKIHDFGQNRRDIRNVSEPRCFLSGVWKRGRIFLFSNIGIKIYNQEIIKQGDFRFMNLPNEGKNHLLLRAAVRDALRDFRKKRERLAENHPKGAESRTEALRKLRQRKGRLCDNRVSLFEMLIRTGGRPQNDLARSLWFLAFFPDIPVCTSCSVLQMGSPVEG